MKIITNKNEHQINIREMHVDDLEKIKDKLQTDFDDFWNYNIFKSELQNPNSKYFCAEYEEKIIGFAGVWKSIDVMHITNIVVKKDCRNMKIGTKLLEKLIEYTKCQKDIKEITLEVHENNIVAQNLYKKYHFEEVRNKKTIL